MTSAVGTIYLGPDVHKDSVTIAVFPADAPAPTRVERLPNDLAKLRRFATRATAANSVKQGRRLLAREHAGTAMRTFGSHDSSQATEWHAWDLWTS